MALSVNLYAQVAGRLPRPLVRRIYARPWLTRSIRAALHPIMPTGLERATVPAGPLAGKQLLVYPRHEASFVSGLWEYWLQEALVANLKPGDNAWDVGAYIGYFTLIMRDRCGPHRVVALEPDPDNRARLEATLSMNGADDVRILPVAAGTKIGTTTIGPGGESPAAATTAGFEGTEVRVTTLDALCNEYGIPTLVKLDVEGAEAAVLRGAPHLLTEIRPVWLIELHGNGGREAIELLSGAGYVIELLNVEERHTHNEHVLAYHAASGGQGSRRPSDN